MLMHTRKHGSQRASVPRHVKVSLCTEPRSEYFVLEDYGNFNVKEALTYITLAPDNMQEIEELREWLKSCEAHLKMEAKKAGTAD